MLFTAFSYNFMVKKYPIAGSAYSYTSLSFGPCVGFLAGWSLLLDYLFLPMINYLLIGLFLNIAFPMVPAWSLRARGDRPGHRAQRDRHQLGGRHEQRDRRRPVRLRRGVRRHGGQAWPASPRWT